MATDKQQAHAAITFFFDQYKAKYGALPLNRNRHALAHGFESLIADYGSDDAQNIIRKYFSDYRDNDPTWFTYHYGEIAKLIDDERIDIEKRRAIRRMTQERMKNIESNSGKGNQVSP